MIKGFLITSRKKEIEDFTSKIHVDEIVVDLTRTETVESTLSSLSSGDTLVIKSLDNVCKDIDELCLLADTCNKKGIKLVSLEGYDVSTLQTEVGASIIAMLLEFKAIKERDADKKVVSYPEGWMDAYSDWKLGKINSREAASRLGISHGTFATRKDVFES